MPNAALSINLGTQNDFMSGTMSNYLLVLVHTSFATSILFGRV